MFRTCAGIINNSRPHTSGAGFIASVVVIVVVIVVIVGIVLLVAVRIVIGSV